MAAGCATHACGIEICAFYEYVLLCLQSLLNQDHRKHPRCTSVFPHRRSSGLLQLSSRSTPSRVVNLVPFRMCGQLSPPPDVIKVEAVQWLSDSQQHEICDVYNIVDRSLSGGSKKVLEPFGRFLDFHASDCDSGISPDIPPHPLFSLSRHHRCGLS